MTLRPLLLAAFAASYAAVPAAHAARFTYHGELMDGDAPAQGQYDLEVRAFATPAGAKALGEATVLQAVAVQDGRFAVELDLPEDADGMTWVQVGVRASESKESFTALGERQPISKANSTCPGAWALDGNTGVPVGSFLGIADPAATTTLELRAQNSPVARFTPSIDPGFGDAPSVALGSGANIANGFGATVSGGGSTIDSGFVCPSCLNRSLGNFATVAGGHSNTAAAVEATVTGGVANEARRRATVGGGAQNLAAGTSSMIPGGVLNIAGGALSFAAGYNAHVRMAGTPPPSLPYPQTPDDFTGLASGDDGSFVWADATGDSTNVMRSTGPNQFVVRATGGVGINVAPAGTDTLVVQSNSAAALPDVTVRLATQSSLREGSIRLLDGTGNLSLTSASGEILLNTVTMGKYIRTNDRLGVKRPPAANDLEIAGDASKAVAGDWLANSDRRIKRNIAPIDHALDTILKLRPVTFRYDDAYRAANRSIVDRHYYNVIAQEFATVFPDAVKGSGEYLAGKPKSAANEILQVDTYPAQIVAIAAIQELAMQDEVRDEDMAALKAENAALRVRLDAVLQRLERLEVRREH